jgi:hypothetical protein
MYCIQYILEPVTTFGSGVHRGIAAQMPGICEQLKNPLMVALTITAIKIHEAILVHREFIWPPFRPDWYRTIISIVHKGLPRQIAGLPLALLESP